MPEEFQRKKDQPKERISTKQCPKCGDTHLLTFTSLFMKSCIVCRIDIPWYLDEGQKPLF